MTEGQNGLEEVKPLQLSSTRVASPTEEEKSVYICQHNFLHSLALLIDHRIYSDEVNTANRNILSGSFLMIKKIMTIKATVYKYSLITYIKTKFEFLCQKRKT